MVQRRRIIRKAMATLLVLSLFVAPALDARAQGIYTGTSSGYDISFPQCGFNYPTLNAYTFGMVGITSGHAFRNNPCFASQYAWAVHTPVPESVYLNLNEDIGATGLYGDIGPYGTCGPDDPCHALNYGYNAASSAYTYAAQQAPAFATRMWWLDIETLNSWSETDLSRNQAVIKGALQYLLVEHGFAVGIYSTAAMWQEITGSWQVGLPAWVGGGTKDDAKMRCDDTAFTGGSVYLVQYDDNGYDANYTC